MNTVHFKEKLEAELKTLTEELQSIGRINPNNPKDWEAVPDSMNVEQADENERADVIEEYGTNNAVLTDLEIRYNEVASALKRIENGTYGTCSVDGQPIEEDRLEANPAATTCKAHLEQE
ncbi:hypothetical protein A3D62_02945 [Candidatus Kaiserbacteria bacterium RIFCSPHIGHO2_02_FULL_49_11]|uniref:Zinc finger DksA/TraR C4-type domain-containing protein n=1 Tax=Candidatus Kaiserbacteria bacterium RIFCSPHIGHO2_02_FULL_49_11 TaxID=1798489 RepID=A0A1F6D0N6_9BACT|nr:MAG: hypothetical protein A3D62_02945 [Candidatus Kaiserbacteria bacterium RIFCSPHIGHO2_02_FULL_49_11]